MHALFGLALSLQCFKLLPPYVSEIIFTGEVFLISINGLKEVNTKTNIIKNVVTRTFVFVIRNALKFCSSHHFKKAIYPISVGMIRLNKLSIKDILIQRFQSIPHMKYTAYFFCNVWFPRDCCCLLLLYTQSS